MGIGACGNASGDFESGRIDDDERVVGFFEDQKSGRRSLREESAGGN